MQKGLVLLLVALSACSPAFARTDCPALDAAADSAGTIGPDFGSGRDVVGRRRVQLYSAPDLACRIDGLFVFRGDVLFAQLEHDGFTRVAVIPAKRPDGRDVIAWVRTSRLRENGKGIVPGSH